MYIIFNALFLFFFFFFFWIKIILSVPLKIKISPKILAKGTNYPPVIKSSLKPWSHETYTEHSVGAKAFGPSIIVACTP